MTLDIYRQNNGKWRIIDVESDNPHRYMDVDESIFVDLEEWE